ncbi:MAG: serine hydrolase [Clostridiales bacterium]|nr:serine hydrolase [Clostridiales bacterium]
MTCGKKSLWIAVCFLLFASAWMLCSVSGQAAGSASASVERTVYSFKDGSGSYLVQKGERWYLRDANGKALTGIQYLAIKKNDVLRSGYYMFDSNGKLLRKKAVYYLNTTVNGLKFKGYYYTNSNGRFPATASGLTKISTQTCHSKTFGGYYYVQEYGKLNTSGVQVRRFSNKKVDGVTFNGYYYFNSSGKLNTTQKFHQVSQTVGSVTFNGKYYFGGTNGVLIQQAGWITYNGNQYYIDSSGKMLTDCWQDGYYLLSNGRIAKSQQVADGSYVDSDGHKCAAEEMELSSLKKTISSMVSSYGGTWSVYVKNLETGDVLSVNDCTMYPASTIKVFVMASVYNEIANGRMSETSTITSLLTSMITVSSNEAYNELVRRQSSSGSSFQNGAAVVNSYLKANGYTSTAVHHTLHPSSSSSTSDGSKNVSSAKDCGELLEAIYNGTCVSKAYSQKMLNLLLAQERRYKIPAGVPSGIKVANKTGETSTTQHDIAIVFGEKTDYVICVFSSGVSEYTAIRGIKSISSMVYEYLN